MISFASVAANCGTAHANAGRGDGLPRKDRRVYFRHSFAWRVQRGRHSIVLGGPAGATCVDFPMKVPVKPTGMEVLSPTILRYAAEVDVRTGEVGAIHDTDAVSAKRSLLEAPLKSMLASQ
jgi:hypothetical protein